MGLLHVFVAGYLRMYNTQESVSSAAELSDSNSKKSSRSSSATMNASSSHRSNSGMFFFTNLML